LKKIIQKGTNITHCTWPFNLKGRKVMTNALVTLKGKPLEMQIEIIETLSKQNREVGDKVRQLIEYEFRSSIFEVKVKDTFKLAIAALLAIAGADITTVPAEPARKPYQRTFEKLCEYFEVELKDVLLMSRYVSKIEEEILSEK
jgi:hypothetical protein